MGDAKDEIESVVGDADFNIMFSVAPCINDKSELASQIASIAGREGISVRKAISSGFMDTRFFIEAGVDTIAFGPGKISLAHTPNEYVVVEDILTAGKIFASLISNLLGRD
jgi:acetylornithine deacetylase/succinyl-diaminopimelate desuccinylase-like protein